MASSYRLEIASPAQKQLKKLPSSVKAEISKRIDNLPDAHQSNDAKKLAGVKNLYRLRVGDYRVIYQVHEGVFLILVLKIGHRKDVYRNLHNLN